MNKKNKKYIKFAYYENNGMSLLIAVFTLGAILLIALSSAAVLLTQAKATSNIENALVALYAADSGVELILYRWAKDPNASAASLLNGATFDASLIDGKIISKGGYRNTNRAIEMTLPQQ